MTARIASGFLPALALSLSALALGPAGTACAQWREAYQSDWLGTAPHNEGYAENVWADVDYTLMRLTGQHLPALVTTAPIGTPLDEAGRLEDPATTVVAGEDVVGDDWRSGIQVRGGVWLEPWNLVAIAGDYFNVGEDRFNFSDGNSGARFVTRPFFNVEPPPGQSRQYANVPGELFGVARVHVDDEFEGAGAGFQCCVFQAVDCFDRDRTLRLDVVSGYRFYRYSSRVDADHTFVALAGNSFIIPAGTALLVEDHFDALNEFHGGELALDGRLTQGKWWIEGLAKVALGASRRSVAVSGRTTEAAPPNGMITSALPGGMLTSEVTNIGRRADTETAVIPELRIGLGFQLMPRLSLRTGYQVVLWDNVAQAATHLPPALVSDPRNLPTVMVGGSEHPEFPGLQESTLVAHGFDVGLEFAY
jgi:hypothetical protein